LIGEVFAILHFVAHVNGDDLEFLLGSTLQHDSPLQNVSIWLIDFDRCSSIEPTNVHGLAAILDKSDLIIPKARTTDPGYISFKMGYLRGAEKVGTFSSHIAKEVLASCEKDRLLKDQKYQSVRGVEGSRETARGPPDPKSYGQTGADSTNWRIR